ncbi:MAG: DNA-processing protein DprA, partial [Actinobacteria bacterium]|nr:DNA-processing protein DprA [Actinomycetota bacterium]
MSAHPSSSLPRYRSSRRVAAAALVNIRSMTPARLRALLTTWPDPRDAAAAVARRDPRVLEVLRELRVGGRTDVGGLVTHWSRNIDIDRVAATLARRGTHVFLWSEPDYPIADQLPNRPAVLLAEGQELEALDAPRVAVVGTRAASPHGLHDAFELGAFLARAGCTVVSGMAIGVDAAAHEGAL